MTDPPTDEMDQRYGDEIKAWNAGAKAEREVLLAGSQQVGWYSPILGQFYRFDQVGTLAPELYGLLPMWVDLGDAKPSTSEGVETAELFDAEGEQP